MYTNIRSCRPDESKTSFPHTRTNICIFTSICTEKSCITFLFIRQIFKSIISPTFDTVLSKLMNSIDQRKGGKVMIDHDSKRVLHIDLNNFRFLSLHIITCVFSLSHVVSWVRFGA